MDDIICTLNRLSSTFTVKDIMIPVDDLITATDQQDAEEKFGTNPDFDVIAIRKDGVLNSYLLRGEDEAKEISAVDLISDGSTIYKLIEIFLDRKFSFVLTGKDISGYIHYSDLNNQLVKIPFYVLFEALERHIIQFIKNSVTEEIIIEKFGSLRAQAHQNRVEKLKKKHADVSLVNFLFFKELLILGQQLNCHSLSIEEIDTFSLIRNKVDHADRPLISEHDDIKILNNVHNLCKKLLKPE